MCFHSNIDTKAINAHPNSDTRHNLHDQLYVAVVHPTDGSECINFHPTRNRSSSPNTKTSLGLDQRSISNHLDHRVSSGLLGDPFCSVPIVFSPLLSSVYNLNVNIYHNHVAPSGLGCQGKTNQLDVEKDVARWNIVYISMVRLVQQFDDYVITYHDNMVL